MTMALLAALADPIADRWARQSRRGSARFYIAGGDSTQSTSQGVSALRLAQE
jgi:hypothetical protein